MLNTITIMGRLVRDPERRVTQTGISVTSFCVAVERDYGSKETDFIDCVAWRSRADFVDKYFNKGDAICVHGKLITEQFTDRNNTKRTAYKISVDNAYFAGSRKAQPELDEIVDDDGDLPWVN